MIRSPRGCSAGPGTREAGILDDGAGHPLQTPLNPQELRRIGAKYDIEKIGPPPHL
jgi:hypothetical protein